MLASAAQFTAWAAAYASARADVLASDDMKGFVAITDNDWFDFLRSMLPRPEEVNFWRPSGDVAFRVLQPGEPFFFKLKSPRNAIGGFGFFVHYTALPVSIAWDVYGSKNGAPTFDATRQRLVRLRRKSATADTREDFWIGCILLSHVTFFEEPDWVALPSDWSPHIEVGKGYDLNSGEGERLWLECQARVAGRLDQVAERPLEIAGGYGSPQLVRPRLGQHSFHLVVLDTYQRRCAVTNEKTLPALEAAHIRWFSDNPEHSVNNGILLRADIHRVFDTGYATITPDFHFLTSRRIKEDFENGADYCRLNGLPIRLPENPRDHPAAEVLQWHNHNRFLG